MSMVPVTLDFRASAASGSRLGKALALIGALALIAAAVVFAQLAYRQFDLQNQVSRHKAEQRRLQNAGLAAAAIDPDGQIARQLTRPWQKLLLAIESASDPRVTLLEIRPDPGRRTIRLVADAATLEEALAYLQRLQKLPELTRPHLVNYTVLPPGAETPGLRFIIQAEWVGA